ncbi:periplasmic heavy metal sensor [Pseudomonas sp. dw_358]|uniref:periplasmic heavy metal sensor n=1 Tax=Pseudomonas sp. dw_358 TaxID=2720083 RepID=UPI001BD2F42A|nr:periplasmic heavy metal sensor [Pseudomonas sp. dw_358]
MMPSATRYKTLLGVSLLFNAFLACAVAGGLYEWHSHNRALEMPRLKGLHGALVQLPEPRSHELRHLLREARRENQPLILAGRQARQDVVRQLQSPNLDREALDKDLADARQADIALRARVDTTLAQFASTLEPQDRLKLASALHLGKVPLQTQAQN